MPDRQPGSFAAANKSPLPPWTWPVLISALAWAVIFISIPPQQQNFPLDDDWAFAHGAIWFSQGLGIHYSKWASMLQLGQWLWSWPFIKLIAIPHVALRVSVIVLSWLGLVAFCELLRLEKIPGRLALFATCVLAMNPVFFLSQGTYMTDVPALSFGLIAMYFYTRARIEKNLRWLWPATVFALFGVLTRQTMLAVPVAAAVPLLTDKEMRQQTGWRLSILIPGAICLFANWWFSQRSDVLKMRTLVHMQYFTFRPFAMVHQCGLTILPLCLLKARQRNWKLFFAGFAAMLLIAAYYYMSDHALEYGGLFPYSGGLVSVYGTFADHLVVGQRDIVMAFPVRVVLTILGCAGAAALISALWETIRSRQFSCILLPFTVLQFMLLLILPYQMDRYMEVLFPGAIFLMILQCAGLAAIRLPAIAVTASSGLIAVALLHDWFAWNSARWELGRQAVATKNIDPSEIEGGFEWNGWHGRNDPNGTPWLKPPAVARGDTSSLVLPFTRDYFPSVTGHYALAFTVPTNAVAVTSLPYSRWLPPAHKEFYLVERQP